VRTGLWTALSLFLTFLVVLIISTIDTPSGEPLLESSAVAQTLATLGLVAAAILPSLLGTRKDASVVREQVQNSHTINQRDDMDQKHDIVVELVGKKFDDLFLRIDDRFSAVASDIRGVRKDVGRGSDAITRLQTSQEKMAHNYHEVQDDLRAVKSDIATLRSTHISVARETGTIHVITDTANPEQKRPENGS
jgi:hypothetical protein